MKQNGFKPKIWLTPRLWKSFKALEGEANLENHVSYYQALASWVKEIYNKGLVNDDILKENRLNILIELDPEKYVLPNVDSSGFYMYMEPNLMFSQEKPTHLETLALNIGNTLWELATKHTGVDCPDCVYNAGLRYVMINQESSQDKELALHCSLCERLLALDGKILADGLTIIPANRDDIAKHT